MKYTVAAVGLSAIVACSPPEYTGDRSPEAVCEYVKDSVDAADASLANVWGVQEVSYDPKSGAVYAVGDVNEIRARLIALEFVNRNLFVSGVYAQTEERVLYFPNVLDRGGESRALALYDIPTTCPSPRRQSVIKTRQVIQE